MRVKVWNQKQKDRMQPVKTGIIKGKEMAPLKKWGKRKIQICRFQQAENERERKSVRGEKEERARL